ncbi:alpha beta hydrolase fold [Trichoderma arundinaceum]|uniref:Alpha beta hydrolase fold n=1 Tax=Trichoderma arundinaceum TaxID=490622 RepID=A0A395NY91_TRIAR|nr:alpha beta hydrolase fold [Trichoderma arundinaceum]
MQTVYLAKPFSTVYEGYCKTKGIQPEIVTLPSGCKAFWMGKSTARNIVIYFHGGAYAQPGAIQHLEYWESVRGKLQADDESLAIFYLEYSLVPSATYPEQIGNGIEAIDHVINTLGRSPSNVMLSGDSAGGNLSIALLSHIMHPIDSLPKLDIGGPLKGIILISPWVSFHINYPSGKHNRYRDIFIAPTSVSRGSDYLAGKPTSEYAEPVTAPASWWKDAQVQGILAVAGGHELHRDSIIEWAERFKSVNPDKLTLVIGKNEAHIAPIIEPALGNKTETEMGKAIIAWMKSVL